VAIVLYIIVCGSSSYKQVYFGVESSLKFQAVVVISYKRLIRRDISSDYVAVPKEESELLHPGPLSAEHLSFQDENSYAWSTYYGHQKPT
jgi:hypothetical protein